MERRNSSDTVGKFSTDVFEKANFPHRGNAALYFEVCCAEEQYGKGVRSSEVGPVLEEDKADIAPLSCNFLR